MYGVHPEAEREGVVTLNTENVSGVVLAGGFSKRMGTDKAKLKLGNLTLLEIQVRKLREIGLEDIMVSGYSRPVEGTRLIGDIYPHRGPMSGIHACLKAAKNPACLVVSVDVPLFPKEWLEKLIQDHSGPSTVLSHGGEIEPLLAVYDADLARQAEELILSGERSVRKLLNDAELKKLEYTGDPDLLLNCNTPEDFRKAASQYG